MATWANYQVGKFDGVSSFSLWKIRMKSAMVLQGLRVAVEDYFSSDDEDESDVDLNQKALSAIFMSVSDNVLRQIAGETSASAAWKKLESLYSRVHMKKKLYALRMAEGTSLQHPLDKFNSIVADMKRIDVTLEDEDLALILLTSLPPSYEPFVDNLLRKQTSISFDHVSNLLKKSYTSDLNKDSKNISNSRMKNSSCFECGQLGHYKQDCPAVTFGNNTWVLDSCAKYHMSPHKHWFMSYKPVDRKVYLNDGRALSVAGIGDVALVLNGVMRFLECWHVPELKRNLISLGTLDSFTDKYYAEGGVLTVSECTETGTKIFLKGSLVAGLYILKGKALALTGCTDADEALLWHYRLGHMSQRELMVLGERDLLPGFKSEEMSNCEHCTFRKQLTVEPSTKAPHKATHGRLDCIHLDIWGPSTTPSKSGSRFFMVFIDDYSRMVWVHFLKSEDQAFPTFLRWKAKIEEETTRKVKRLHTENGLEFCHKAFNNFCKSEGIARNCVQNSVAERMKKTLYDKALCMLSHSGVDKDFWAEAVNTATYLVNRSPSMAIDFKTPFEVWSNSPANYSDYTNLKAFGCLANVHATDGNLERTVKKCIFIGYASEGYKLWRIDPESPRLIISNSVNCFESAIV